MPVSCGDLVAFGQAANPSADEVTLRAAISRAYYGAYHRSLAWEKLLPMPGSNTGTGGGVHQDLINRLKNPDSSCTEPVKMKSRSLAYQLTQMKVIRTTADYELAVTVTFEQAADVVSKATKLLVDFPA